MSKDVKYSKSTGAIVIKANTVTYVDDNLVTAKELKDCYGSRISIMSPELVEEIIGEVAEFANTGDEAVDDFLNGKTDELPEGTEEISNEEALRLQKEAEEQAAKAKKAEAPKKAPAKSKGKTGSKKK